MPGRGVLPRWRCGRKRRGGLPVDLTAGTGIFVDHQGPQAGFSRRDGRRHTGRPRSHNHQRLTHHPGTSQEPGPL